ncbi:cytochrome C [Novosphingobium cyanobacteriorum]|uniref:Cytochrome C n=1 Tax=Novosphingobium cyanobacteriorum TaxID=3024215 RepID=A0ABT6CN71_9SPHN|nr:cytochrome C [Novosphingobium cyanobacteriorum]MDF8334683.1 cytochrome C [Novosphingobium cyanobacteriorum]
MRKGSIALAASATLVLCGAVAARPLTFSPPAEAVPAVLVDSEGEIVVNICSTCHSLEYIVTQPRGKGAQFWKDSVAKMINVYKAPIAPADADAIAAVLARKFG